MDHFNYTSYVSVTGKTKKLQNRFWKLKIAVLSKNRNFSSPIVFLVGCSWDEGKLTLLWFQSSPISMHSAHKGEHETCLLCKCLVESLSL